MLVSSVLAWSGLAALLALASLAGLMVTRCLPWGPHATEAGIPMASGLVLAPFLAGLAAVLALGPWGGASHAFHLVFVLLLLTVSAFFAWWHGRRQAFARRPAWPRGAALAFAILLLAYAAVLIWQAVALPLTQNDSLEYATVGRLLYETRDLAAYPAIHPERSASGFYGPWTHPPLYVALIYLTQVLQGHAEAPGLMRLIAPWFLLAGTALVYALGRQVSQRVGMLAALFFISTPLLFLGADSALIDPLPIAGLTLVFALLIGLEGPPRRVGALAGIALGLALWTHSQALLFVPLGLAVLLARHGLRGWREAGAAGGAMVLVALLVAAWPYARNLQVLGSLISDTPIVFALPQQAWEEYFRYARGIDSWPALIQYGIFKGWFVLEAYSIAFWMALVGMGGYLWPRRWAWRSGFLIGGRTEIDRVLWAAFAVLVVYWSGAVVSVLAGMTLMVRNERYWLVLMPFVSLFAAFGIESLLTLVKLHFGHRRVAEMLGIMLLCGIFIVSLLQLWTMVQYRYRPYQSSAVFGAPQDWAFRTFQGRSSEFRANPAWLPVMQLSVVPRYQGWPNLLAMEYLRQSTPAEALVFSLRPADMYYSGRRMISYLDPRLLAFYSSKETEAAWRELVGLGISYIHLSDYFLPPVYRSPLQQILVRPDLAELAFSANGHQIYRLRFVKQPMDKDWASQDISPASVPWTQRSQRMLGGRKALETMTLSRRSSLVIGDASQEKGSRWFQREWSTLLLSGEDGTRVGHSPGIVSVPEQTEFRVRLNLSGLGYVKLWVIYLNADGQPLWERNVLIGELVLGESNPEQLFVRRLLPPPSARWLRLGVEHIGDSHIRVNAAEVAWRP